MRKKVERRLKHNIGSHEERMILRRTDQSGRVSSVRVKTGKYNPRVEDKKHATI